MAINYKNIESRAAAAQSNGGAQRELGDIIVKLLRRIVELEKENQRGRQQTLFGDVLPPPKTPIGT